jgi:hypothetical protein
MGEPLGLIPGKAAVQVLEQACAVFNLKAH